MSVKTKPRYRGINIEVKYNPIFKTHEEFEAFEREYHQPESPTSNNFWKRLLNIFN